MILNRYSVTFQQTPVSRSPQSLRTYLYFTCYLYEFAWPRLIMSAESDGIYPFVSYFSSYTSSWFLQCSKHVRIFFPLDGFIQLMFHSHRFSLHAFSLPWVRNVCQDRHLVQQLIVEVLTYHRLKSRCPSDSSFLITRDLGDSKR